MKSWNKIGGTTQAIERHFSHAGHDAHARHNVRAIGQFDSDAALRRSRWPHDVGNHIHGSALHGSVEQGRHGLLGFGGSNPIIGGSGVFAFPRADIGYFFRARYIAWITAVEYAVR